MRTVVELCLAFGSGVFGALAAISRANGSQWGDFAWTSGAFMLGAIVAEIW